MVRLIVLALVALVLLTRNCFAQGESKPAETASPGPLPEWVQYATREDPITKWSLGARRADGELRFFEAQLVSQDWGGVWEHKIQVCSPARPLADDLAVLFIGNSYPQALGNLSDASRKIGLACAGLGGIPCKSFGQVGEAAMMAGALVFLQTGNPDFAPFAPLVRAAVRAMDCIEAESPRALGRPIKRFILVGHSKGGGTAWWSAVIDPRVAGIVVIGADLLNTKAQNDTYATVNLNNFMPKGTPLMDREALMKMLYASDPYPWRDKLTMPKLIVQGANDEHFVTGATRFYFDDLPGGKWMLNLPNATHGGAGEAGEVPHPATAAAIVAMAKSIASGKPLPELKGKFEQADGKLTISVQCPAAARRVLLWSAENSSQDFRFTRWNSKPLAPAGSPAWTARAELPLPAGRHMAAFVSAEIEHDEQTFWLSTLIHVAKPG